MTSSVNLLSLTTNRCKKVVDHIGEKYPDEDRVKRLIENFNPQKIYETLPTSEHTAYTENKGEKLAFCLNKERGGDEE